MATLAAVACLYIGGSFSCGIQLADTLLAEEFSIPFQNPHRIAVTPSSSILVTDDEANSVSFFSRPGSEAKTIGGFGWGETTFDRPSGAATDGVNIYVADYGNHRIQRYDRALNFVSTLSTRDTSVERARFGFPLAVALSRQGDLFVLDGENVRVVKFTNQSKFERTFGDIESAVRLKRPLSLVVTPDDRVLVLEPDQVLEFDFSGNFVRAIGKGFFRDARGFAAAPEGFLVVEASSILWFDENGVLRTRTRVEEIVTQKNIRSFRDVAVFRSRLFLLTEHSLNVFTIISDHQ